MVLLSLTMPNLKDNKTKRSNGRINHQREVKTSLNQVKHVPKRVFVSKEHEKLASKSSQPNPTLKGLISNSSFHKRSRDGERGKKRGRCPSENEEHTSKTKTCDSTQTNAYAGAKFSDPPSPKVLPKPPSHWMANNENAEPNKFDDMTSHLKMLLKVHVQA